MARKIIFTFLLCYVGVANAQLGTFNRLRNRLSDTTQADVPRFNDDPTNPSLWRLLNDNSSTHLGLGISPGFNNTVYMKVSRRYSLPNMPIGVYQSVEFATEHKYDWLGDSPLFRLPFGVSIQLNDRWTILAGTDVVSKILYNYAGIRKDLAVCYVWGKTPITVGYSFFMGPNLMLGLPSIQF